MAKTELDAILTEVILVLARKYGPFVISKEERRATLEAYDKGKLRFEYGPDEAGDFHIRVEEEGK